MIYADDTQLYITVKSGQILQMLPKLENCLHAIRFWLTENFLLLNDNKMEVLHLLSHRRKNTIKLLPIQITNGVVNSSKTVVNLGVMFDPNLSMRPHVNCICRRASFALSKIRKIRKFLSKSSTEILVHAFISSLLDSCNSLLHGIPEKDMAKLQRIQNSAARLVSLTKKHDHITPTLKQLHWLPIQFRVHFKVLLLTFKSLHGHAPNYLSELIQLYTLNRPLRSANQTLLTVKKAKTKYLGDRSFSCSAPRLWNSLPASIRCISDITLFRSKLKTYLMENAYST